MLWPVTQYMGLRSGAKMRRGFRLVGCDHGDTAERSDVGDFPTYIHRLSGDIAGHPRRTLKKTVGQKQEEKPASIIEAPPCPPCPDPAPGRVSEEPERPAEFAAWATIQDLRKDLAADVSVLEWEHTRDRNELLNRLKRNLAVVDTVEQRKALAKLARVELENIDWRYRQEKERLEREKEELG